MSWGAMMGLGQGLQQVGGMLMDMNKEKMRNQLEMERDKRKEALDIAKEQRQLEQFGGSYEFDRDNGLKYRINKAGNRMADPTPISADELAAYKREQEIADLDAKIKRNTAKKGGLELVLTQDKIDNAAVDRDLSRRLEEARIQSEQARAGSYSRANRGSGSGEDSKPTQAQAAKLLTTEYKSLVDSYVGTADKPGPLSRNEVEEIAMEAARAAALQRKDPTVIFRDELARRAAFKKDPNSLNFR